MAFSISSGFSSRATWSTDCGATGAFQFRETATKDGKPGGYDAKQAAIVSVTKAGKYSIEK